MRSDPPLDFLGTLGALVRHQVQFVLIGGVAGNIHGSPIPTKDVDVAPEPSEANLERVAAALREIDARLRVDEDSRGVAFDVSGRSLTRAAIWNLRTDLGRDATTVDLGDGLVVQVASVRDLIRMKEASGRAKDMAGLPALRAVLARTERGSP